MPTVTTTTTIIHKTKFVNPETDKRTTLIGRTKYTETARPVTDYHIEGWNPLPVKGWFSSSYTVLRNWLYENGYTELNPAYSQTAVLEKSEEPVPEPHKCHCGKCNCNTEPAAYFCPYGFQISNSDYCEDCIAQRYCDVCGKPMCMNEIAAKFGTEAALNMCINDDYNYLCPDCFTSP